jgi:cytochrome c oxidase subunit I+III
VGAWILFFVFIIGGMTGVMLGSVPVNLQVHDPFFVVAHFHYVLIGGSVFPLFGALYYWFRKITGRMLGERLGKWSFGLFFTGFNVTFFPMQLLCRRRACHGRSEMDSRCLSVAWPPSASC